MLGGFLWGFAFAWLCFLSHFTVILLARDFICFSVFACVQFAHNNDHDKVKQPDCPVINKMPSHIVTHTWRIEYRILSYTTFISSFRGVSSFKISKKKFNFGKQDVCVGTHEPREKEKMNSRWTQITVVTLIIRIICVQWCYRCRCCYF